MDITSEYEFVPLEANRIAALIRLYKSVFKVSYTHEQIKAKYFNDYSGICAQGHFAIYNGKVVAFHGAIPLIMSQNGAQELCAQFGDAMTLKSHTGKGLFTILGKLTEAKLKDLGVKFVWGFPNQNSEYGYVNKLNWKGKQRMQCFIIPLKKLSTEQIHRKSKVLYRGYLDKMLKTITPYLHEKQGFGSTDYDTSGGIYRSLDYFKYKSFGSNYLIKINDHKVWIKPVGGLLIGDIELTSPERLMKTIEALKTLAIKLGLNKIVIQASPNSRLYAWMKEKYSPFDSWLIGFKDFDSSFDFDQLQFTYGDLDTF